MNCAPFELSTGLMIFISLALFWIGICFITGMKQFGNETIFHTLRGVRMALEDLRKIMEKNIKES